MCKQTLVLDAHSAIVRPPCSGGLLVSLPPSPLLPLPPRHLDLADAALRSSAADSQKSLPYKTTLALFMVLDYG